MFVLCDFLSETFVRYSFIFQWRNYLPKDKKSIFLYENLEHGSFLN